MTKKIAIESTAEAYLEMLAARGVEYLFANAGTDFAPLIEAWAKRLAQGQALPKPVTVPHETPAMAMAHGYAMVTGRPSGCASTRPTMPDTDATRLPAWQRCYRAPVLGSRPRGQP